MKKFFKIFAIAAATLFTVATVSAFTEPEKPQVTINLAGFENPMYMSLATCDAIYNLLPTEIQQAATAAYKDLATKPYPKVEYNGVTVKYSPHVWTFEYQGSTVVVNAKIEELKAIFVE